MQAVRRSPEPQIVADLRAADTQWDDLEGASRRRIRDALAQDFGPICAYCQQACRPTRPRGQAETEETPVQHDEESIDHFRPRNSFPDLRFDWDNLVYSCYRCNQSKAGKWPVPDDMTNRLLAAANRPRYTPVSEYVSPNEVEGRRPAQDFFSFDVDTGEITPVEVLDEVEWSVARRTIHDIDLNGELGELGLYDPNHVVNQTSIQSVPVPRAAAVRFRLDGPDGAGLQVAAPALFRVRIRLLRGPLSPARPAVQLAVAAAGA